ncbi:MAG: hypothetical protein ABFC38_06870 [Methanospirillum sp.]
MTELRDEKFDRSFLISNVLFSSLFFLGIFMILQARMGLFGPMLGTVFLGDSILRILLSLLSLVGATGILISFRRSGRTGIWAVPALAVTFSLLIGFLGYLVVILNSPHTGTGNFAGFVYNLLDSLFILGLLASTALMFLGYGQSGCKMARITAAVPALFGVLSIPYVLQALSLAARILEGVPVRSEDATVGLLYLIFVLPGIGLIIIAHAFFCTARFTANNEIRI